MPTAKETSQHQPQRADLNHGAMRFNFLAGSWCAGMYAAMAHQYRGQRAVSLYLKDAGYRQAIRARLLRRIYAKRTEVELSGGELFFCLGKLTAMLLRCAPLNWKIRKLYRLETKGAGYLNAVIHHEPVKSWDKIFRRTLPEPGYSLKQRGLKLV